MNLIELSQIILGVGIGSLFGTSRLSPFIVFSLNRWALCGPKSAGAICLLRFYQTWVCRVDSIQDTILVQKENSSRTSRLFIALERMVPLSRIFIVMSLIDPAPITNVSSRFISSRSTIDCTQIMWLHFQISLSKIWNLIIIFHCSHKLFFCFKFCSVMPHSFRQFSRGTFSVVISKPHFEYFSTNALVM